MPRREPSAGTTYYWSSLVLPRLVRHHVWALYAFCRFADDIVDDLGDAPAEAREQALAAYGDRFFADLAAGRSDDPVLRAVVHTARAYGHDPDVFRRFLASMAMDLSVDRYATWDDLLEYMDGSAAVIGEMMLPILEPDDLDAALGPARDLGLAFQLTNFLRDVAEDLDRGRVYLPQQDLARFDADPRPAGRRPRVARPHAVRDRTVPSACTGRPAAGIPHAAARVGPVRAHRIGAVLGDPGPHRGGRLRRVHPPGHACRPGTKVRPRPGPRSPGGAEPCTTRSSSHSAWWPGHCCSPASPHHGPPNPPRPPAPAVPPGRAVSDTATSCRS